MSAERIAEDARTELHERLNRILHLALRACDAFQPDKLGQLGEDYRALLKYVTAHAQPCPDGWVMVPKVLTRQMEAAAENVLELEPGGLAYAHEVWEAMLAASPLPDAMGEK